MTRTASQQGRRSRNKGASFERQVARALRPIFGDGVKRGLAQSRFGRGEAPDVDGCAPFWCETKNGIKPNLRGALQQAVDAMAVANRPGDRWPIAVCKDDRKPAVVMMRWEHFLEMIEEYRVAEPYNRAEVLDLIKDATSNQYMLQWVDKKTSLGDFAGRDKAIDVFNIQTSEEASFLRAIRPHRKKISELLGGSCVFVFHSPEATRKHYSRL